MNYEQSLEYLNAVCKPSTKPGLERVKAILSYLGNPERKLKLIHVAGTNGKGSTSAMLLSILKNSGYRVGFYSSPHLYNYTERMTIDGVEIARDKFASYVQKIKEKVIPQLLADGLDHPSEFEVLTALGYLYFLEEKVDLAIIEVGLGGTFDATNVIHPVLSMITPVSIDHCNFLGNTIDSIAREKAGIIKEKTPVVCAPQQVMAMEVIQTVAQEKEAPVYWVSRDQHKDEQGKISVAILGKYQYDQLYIGLRGEHQRMNATTAMTAAHCLINLGWTQINPETIRQGIEGAKWPGRQEVFSIGKKQVLIDGAHNQAGIDTLVYSLTNEYRYRKLVVVLGILDDKDKQGMMGGIAPLAQQIYITRPNSARAQNWEQLGSLAKQYNDEVEVMILNQYQEAIDLALRECDSDDLVCITGSLYLIGDCRRYLEEKIAQESIVGLKVDPSIKC